MRKRQHKKLIHEGNYVAKVNVKIIDTDEGWSPVISLDDAQKLDDVREPFRRGFIKSAGRLARVFVLTAVAI